jgi:D-glycero-D-manno-heptose 1,7-bisphosphate phosphatase
MNIVFLDRDGTVIIDPPDERVDKEAKIKLFPDSIEALRTLADHNFAVIFITNQAGIAEGRIDLNGFQRINNKALDMLAPSGVKLLKTYVCPHSPDEHCECRKPKPTLLLRAARDFKVDLANSYMVGDRESDIMAGVNAGTKTILVKTANTPVVSPEATYTASSLIDAVKYIVNN